PPAPGGRASCEARAAGSRERVQPPLSARDQGDGPDHPCTHCGLLDEVSSGKPSDRPTGPLASCHIGLSQSPTAIARREGPDLRDGAPNAPGGGNSTNSPGSPFNGGSSASHYAGQQPQNSANGQNSQYDVACFQ